MEINRKSNPVKLSINLLQLKLLVNNLSECGVFYNRALNYALGLYTINGGNCKYQTHSALTLNL